MFVHPLSPRKQRLQIKPLMFVSACLYPLASISIPSHHQLMCVALKSNLLSFKWIWSPLGRSRKAPHQLTSCSLFSPWSFELGSGGSSGCWCYAVCWFSLFLLATSQAEAKALVRKSHNPLAVLLSSAKTMRQGSHFKAAHRVLLEHQDPSGQCFITFTPAPAAGTRRYITRFLELVCYWSTPFSCWSFVSQANIYNIHQSHM